MPKALEEALARSYTKRKRAGKLKGVDRGAYIYGSKPMQAYLKEKRG